MYEFVAKIRKKRGQMQKNMVYFALKGESSFGGGVEVLKAGWNFGWGKMRVLRKGYRAHAMWA